MRLGWMLGCACVISGCGGARQDASEDTTPYTVVSAEEATAQAKKQGRSKRTRGEGDDGAASFGTTEPRWGYTSDRDETNDPNVARRNGEDRSGPAGPQTLGGAAAPRGGAETGDDIGSTTVGPGGPGELLP